MKTLPWGLRLQVKPAVGVSIIVSLSALGWWNPREGWYTAVKRPCVKRTGREDLNLRLPFDLHTCTHTLATLSLLTASTSLRASL